MARAFRWTIAVLLAFITLGETLAAEESVRIPSTIGSLQLFLRHQAPVATSGRASVLFLHGATFPSGNSAAWRIDGRSWMDELADAGFDVWALDFLGYGGSDRYPEMANDDAHGGPLGDIESMVEQVDRAVAHIREQQGGSKVHIVAHSAGTLVAGRYAELHTDRVARLVLFGAPAPLAGNPHEEVESRAHVQVTVADQLESFDVRVRETGRLDANMFKSWAEAYLGSDPHSTSRQPHSVRVPLGMRAALQEMTRLGRLPYDPTRLTTPTLIIQGEWDAVSPPSEGFWIFERVAAPLKRFVVLSQGGHRLHLEASRFQLYREVECFLMGRDQTQ